MPFGKIVETDETCPTLTYNDIGRHQSRIVRVRVASAKSPWLSGVKAGDVFSVPISHGEGKFVASDELIQKLAESGQIMTQYVDLAGAPSTPTAAPRRSRASSRPTAGCSARWGIPSARASGSIRMLRASTT